MRPQVHWSDPVLQEHPAERQRWGAELGTMIIFLGMGGVLQLLFYRQHRRYLEHALLALGVTTWYLLLVSVGQFATIFIRLGQSGVSELKLAQWLAPTVVVYSWFALRRFYGAARWYTTLAAVVLFLSQALLAAIVNVIVVALLLVTA